MRIEKRGYSRNPWRLVTAAGTEISALRKFEHPTLGLTTVYQPIMGSTKTECSERALSLLAELWELTKRRGEVCSACSANLTTTERLDSPHNDALSGSGTEEQQNSDTVSPVSDLNA